MRICSQAAICYACPSCTSLPCTPGMVADMHRDLGSLESDETRKGDGPPWHCLHD